MCIFCGIVAGEVPADVVRSDESALVFRDIDPQAPVHLLVIPRRHITSLNAADPADLELLGKLVLLAREVAEEMGIAETGYRLVLNVGKDGAQSVDHIHFHVLGGRALGWPPG